MIHPVEGEFRLKSFRPPLRGCGEVLFFACHECFFALAESDLLSCIDKKVGKEALPLRLPTIRVLLAYSVKLCDSPSLAHHKGSASCLAPLGFHLRLAKRLSWLRKGIVH